MGHVAANTDPKVGYRAYQTNPFGAAHLSGLGDAAPNYIPSGTRLVYQASFVMPVNFSINTPKQLQTSIQSDLLNTWGIAIVGETDSYSILSLQRPSFVLQLQTQRDYGAVADIQGILDGELMRVGAGTVTSTMNVVAIAPPASATVTVDPTLVDAYNAAVASGDTNTASQLLAQIQQTASVAGSAIDLGSFLSTYGIWIGAGLVGVLVLPALIGGGKRRR